MSALTVLVVDDEPDLLALVGFVLHEAEVLACHEPEAAAELLRTHDVDVLLLDVTMPGLDGPSLLRRLRADGLAPDAVFLASAIPRTVLGELAAETGAVALPKPFTATQLRAALAEHLPS